MIKTKLTEMLGIKYPIIQSGMADAAFPPLAAAVCNAGGLGILGAQAMSAAEVRKAIRWMHDLTDKPFGINFLPYHPEAEKILEIMIEEKVAVASYGRGDPTRIIERTKPAGIFNLPTIGAVSHAIKAEQRGADAVIIQGTEAGGHCSYVSTTVLLPKAVDAVEIPVIAAGGFCDGRGLVAALSLGAQGVAMGTRFILTKECTVPDNIKQFFIRSGENDTIITDKVTGTRCRGLRNKLTGLLETNTKGLNLFKAAASALAMSREFGVSPLKILKTGLRMKEAYEMEFSKVGYASFGRSRIKSGVRDGDEGMGFLPCGQVCGRINDIPSVKDLIESIIAEAGDVLDKICPMIKARE